MYWMTGHDTVGLCFASVCSCAATGASWWQLFPCFVAPVDACGHASGGKIHALMDGLANAL
jgi:hypothetical protein